MYLLDPFFSFKQTNYMLFGNLFFVFYKYFYPRYNNYCKAIKTLRIEKFIMPTWNQIQSQLRNPHNPVVFFDITVGRTVCINILSSSNLTYTFDTN